MEFIIRNPRKAVRFFRTQVKPKYHLAPKATLFP